MIGRNIAEYRILERLGGGGMGVVYKAEDMNLKHTVALKLLPVEWTRNPEARERFLHEAQAAFALDHPNICAVHRVGETDDGQMFIVMSYYEGETLKRRIERGTVPFAEAREIVTQIARGLEMAHAHGIIHRDIKPSNIMITSEGVVKILDFGIAKLGDWTGITTVGSTVGTVAYMSPEQARGETLDPRTDIWSLGAVLYETLTGQAPFQGDYAEVILYSILNVDPVALSQRRPGIPADLAELCQRCLGKNRTSRPGSMREVLNLLGGRPHHVVPRWLSVGLTIVITGLVIWQFLLPLIRPPDERSDIAIMPFRILTGNTEDTIVIRALQSMVDHELKHLNVYAVDINSFDEFLVSSFGSISNWKDRDTRRFAQMRIRYLLDGTISRDSGGYALQMEVQDLVHAGVARTDPVFFPGFDSLDLAVRALLPKVLDYLQVEKVSDQRAIDIGQWMRGRPENLEAHKALMEASAFIYKMEPGGDKYLRRAIELDSMFIPPRVWLISSLYAKGQTGEATQHYTFLKRHEMDVRGFDNAMIEWCGALLKGDIRAQARCLKSALEYCPGNTILRFNIAGLKYYEGDWQGIIDSLTPIVNMRWQYSPAYWFLGVSYMHLAKYDQARDVLEEGLSIAPSVWPGNYALLAVLSWREHDTARALNYVQRCIMRSQERASPPSWPYAELGGTFSDWGFPNEAIGYYRSAVSYEPGIAEYHDSLSVLLGRIGDLRAAKEEGMKAIQLDSTAASPHYSVGMISLALRDTLSAVQHFKEYLRRDSVSDRAREVYRQMSILQH